MTLVELQAQIAIGEDNRRQFKQYRITLNLLISEMATFTNTEGATIFIVVADDSS